MDAMALGAMKARLAVGRLIAPFRDRDVCVRNRAALRVDPPA